MEKLYEWSYKMQGAREMLQHLRTSQGARIDLDPAPRGEGKVFTEAIFDLVLKSLDNTDKCLQGRKIGYCNHQRDKKGKLIHCDAYFI